MTEDRTQIDAVAMSFDDWRPSGGDLVESIECHRTHGADFATRLAGTRPTMGKDLRDHRFRSAGQIFC